MGYYWRCPECGRLWTFDDDESPCCGPCFAAPVLAKLDAMAKALYDPEEDEDERS